VIVYAEREAINRAERHRPTRLGVAAFAVGAVIGVILGVLLLAERAESKPPCAAVGSLLPVPAVACPAVEVQVATEVQVSTAVIAATVKVGPSEAAVTASVRGPLRADASVGEAIPAAPVALPDHPGPQQQVPMNVESAPTAGPRAPAATISAADGIGSGRPAPQALSQPPTGPQPPTAPLTPAAPAPGAPAGTDRTVDAAAGGAPGLVAVAAALPVPAEIVVVPAFGGPGEHHGRAPPTADRPG
jgi:hypothetical protein